MRISDWSSDVCSSDLRLILRGTLLTIAILVVTRLLLAASDRGFRRLFAVGAETRLRFPGLEARANRYLTVLLGTIREVLYVVAAFAVLQAWGIDRSEDHTSELQSQMRISYALFRLKKTKKERNIRHDT